MGNRARRATFSQADQCFLTDGQAASRHAVTVRGPLARTAPRSSTARFWSVGSLNPAAQLANTPKIVDTASNAESSAGMMLRGQAHHTTDGFGVLHFGESRA
jgi:hypothetical protein